MFTGIVDHCGEIIEAKVTAHTAEFQIQSQFQDIKEGESISVDGICLTAVNPQAGKFKVQISPETMEITAISHYKTSDKVNLERSLTANDRIGGHYVSGHVDGTATVTNISPIDDFISMTIMGIAEKEKKYLIHKGSIAVNGVSLTVNKIIDNGFELMLIPHTLEITNLSELKVGDRVNIEFDMLTKLNKRELAETLEQV